MLVITPIVCVTAAIAFSNLLNTYLDPVVPDVVEDAPTEAAVSTPVAATGVTPTKKAKKSASASKSKSKPPSATFWTIAGVYGLDTRLSVLGLMTFFLLYFVYHCTWVTSSAYSSPSVVLASRNADGSQNIIDDFREAYYWLRQNTEKDAVVMSWWDYGYQIAGMADRPVRCSSLLQWC